MLSNMDKAERVLDLGCGNGVFLTTLSYDKRIESRWGIDVNQTAVGCAAMVAQSNSLPLKFSCATSFERWPEERFDTVSVVDVMYHLPPELLRRFVHEALARVKLGGTFLFNDMCSQPRWRFARIALQDLVLASGFAARVGQAASHFWASVWPTSHSSAGAIGSTCLD